MAAEHCRQCRAGGVFYFWLLLPDAHGWQVAASGLLALVVIFFGVWLRAGSFAYFRVARISRERGGMARLPSCAAAHHCAGVVGDSAGSRRMVADSAADLRAAIRRVVLAEIAGALRTRQPAPDLSRQRVAAVVRDLAAAIHLAAGREHGRRGGTQGQAHVRFAAPTEAAACIGCGWLC